MIQAPGLSVIQPFMIIIYKWFNKLECFSLRCSSSQVLSMWIRQKIYPTVEQLIVALVR
jgi:hypothetical protein